VNSETESVVLVGFFDTLMFRHVDADQVVERWAVLLRRRFRALAGMATGDLVDMRNASREKCLEGHKEVNYSQWMSVYYQLLVRRCPGLAGESSEENFREIAHDIELAVECGVQYPNSRFLKYLAGESERGRRIYIVTDYHLGKEDILAFLHAKNVDTGIFSDILVSSDYDAQKGDGSLYRVVLSREGIQAGTALMIGSDSINDGTMADGRSDVIILIHVSSDRKKVYLVHFPRDMYVEVPGHGKDKINAAYAYGGPQLLVRTLRKLVDVPIDHMAVIGFQGFKAMTDAVGGVDVYAEEASTEFGTIHVGMNHLDGEAALGFVRERYQLSKGDISRGRRQQAFIKALMLKALSKETLSNPVRFAKFVDAATRNLTVDNTFSVADIYSQALAMRNLRSQDIVFITAPITGFGRSPQGASIDIVDYAKMGQLSTALRTDDMSSIPLGQQIP
jgi:LCP family protein required for cell wall assembly